MARATRAKPAPKEPTPEPAPSSTKPLPEATPNPPKLFVLPKDTSKDARIVTLDNPASGTPSRYFFCPLKGFYEFTRIAAPKKACRSWLITSRDEKDAQNTVAAVKEQGTDTAPEPETGLGSGFVAADASLFLATPIDLLFLVLPALAPKSSREEKQHFLALDDYTDALSTASRHWKTLLAHHASLKSLLEKKLRLVCDTVDAGDETMYRISHSKLLDVLLSKAERMVQRGLPASMEDKFVKTALEVPVLSIRREDSTLSAVSSSDTPTTTESQDTPATTPGEEETSAPEPPALSTPDTIPHLLRLRTALTYLTSSYLPPSLQTPITTLLTTDATPSINFTPLTTHLAALSALKTEAAALRSISDNMSRKRAFEVDEDKIAEREEKKRRKEEEALRKKNESLGVKKLRKVDTSGMKKMSSFFTVKPKGKGA